MTKVYVMPENLMLKNTHAPGEKGFTIIEVVAVIVIISILAAYAVSRMDFNVNLQAEVDQFKSNLRYVQQIALCGDGRYTWRINVGEYSYTFTRWDGATSTQMSLPNETTHTFPTGIRVSAGTGTINFDQWGSPGGNDITITLTDGSTTGNITVTRNTGFVP